MTCSCADAARIWQSDRRRASPNPSVRRGIDPREFRRLRDLGDLEFIRSKLVRTHRREGSSRPRRLQEKPPGGRRRLVVSNMRPQLDGVESSLRALPRISRCRGRPADPAHGWRVRSGSIAQGAGARAKGCFWEKAGICIARARKRRSPHARHVAG